MSVLAAWPRPGYLPVVGDPPLGADPVDPPAPDGEPVPTPWVTLPTDEAVNMLTPVQGRLVVAYGGHVGGAKRILTVTPDGTVGVGPLVPTEGFFVARTYDGATYMPWVDPTGAWIAPQGYSVTTDGATWTNRHVVPAYHLFDVRRHAGDLFMCGSGPTEDGAQSAIVIRSRDGGATWEESLRVPADGMPRIYVLAVAGGDLYAPLLNTTGPSPRVFKLAASGEWVEVPADLPATAAPHLVVHAAGKYYSLGGTWDGTTRVDYTGYRPCWADATHVYAIDTTAGSIDRALLTDAIPVWDEWLPLGPSLSHGVARTAVIHDGHVYVGGTQGRVWRVTP